MVFLCLAKLAFSLVYSILFFSLPFSISLSILFISFSLTRVNSSRFNLNGLFCFVIPFLIHYLPFLATLSPHPYTLLYRPLKCLIQPIIACLNSFSFVLLSFACLFQLCHLIYNSTGCSYSSPVLSDNYSREFIQ